ncbi:formyltransferase family protein [Spirillospora sp. NPDC046719]
MSMKATGVPGGRGMESGSGVLSVERSGERPLRVAAIGSEGPHHLYLYSVLAGRFDLTGVIVEQGDRWHKRLLRRRRYRDWFYRLVHEYRQKLHGYRRYREAFFAELGPHTPPETVVRVPSVNAPEAARALLDWDPDITIVFAVSILGDATLKAAGTAINVHAGCLPRYRGNQGIFMALYHGDEGNAGASLHLVRRRVDAGPLLAVLHAPVAPDDTEEMVWCRALKGAIDELVDLLGTLERGGTVPYQAQPPGGHAIRNRDRGLRTDLVCAWRRLRRHRLTPYAEWRIERPEDGFHSAPSEPDDPSPGSRRRRRDRST